jgi:hypothetical protein
MSVIHRSVSNPINPRTTTKVLTHSFVLSALAVIAYCLFTLPTYAQGSLPLGTLTITGNGTCNTSDGWYYYTSPNGTKYYLTCQTATVSGCSNAQDSWGLTFGYLSPTTVNPQIQPLGTIVIFSGDGGGTSQLLGNFGYAQEYFEANYEIVQFAWTTGDWEYSYGSFGNGQVANIQNAACRPATFLNYVYNNLFLGPINNNQNQRAGFCAHGASAGSAAVAYSLAYYGAGAWKGGGYLDNVELLAGPVFSDINQGCEVPGTPAPVVVCGQTNYNGGQYGCQLGAGGLTWLQSAAYVGVNGQVGMWTNDSTCAGQNTTTQASDSAWLAQSIVDQSTGATPSFTYSNTAMSAWLCRSVANNGAANNSSPQGQIFYAQIGQSNSPPHYDVYAVDNCSDDEGVGGGTVPGFYPNNNTQSLTGFYDVIYDMVGNLTHNIPAQCFHGTHQQ